MNQKLSLNESINSTEGLNLNKKMKLFKDTKWISFGTYIMTVECYITHKGVVSYVPMINIMSNEETSIVKASYNGESYYIENKELCKNVSIGDKIIVTIKFSYDKDDNLIYTNVHHSHPYALTDI